MTNHIIPNQLAAVAENDRRLVWLDAAVYARLVHLAAERGVTPDQFAEQFLADVGREARARE